MAKKNIKFELTAVNKTKGAFAVVNKGLGVMGKSAKFAASGLKTIGVAAGATAATLAVLAKVNTDFLDKIGKTASKLGVEAEFLQQLRFAAEQTGVKVEALDMGLQRFIRRAAEAAKGTGEAKRAFEQLGIELLNSDGTLRPVREILFDVADGLKNTGSSAEQVRLAFKFFDSEGVALVNTLKGGSQALKEFERQAESLGIIISNETVKKGELFADRLNIIRKQITAITANITGAFIPALDSIAANFTSLIVGLNETEGGLEKFGKKIALTVLNFTRTTLIGILNFIDEVEKRLINFAETKIGKEIFGDIGSENKKLRAEFDLLKKRYDELIGAFIRGEPFIDGLFDEVIASGPDVAEELKRVKNQLIALNNEIQSFKPENNPLVLAIDDLIKKVGESDFAKIFEGSEKTFDNISEQVALFRDQLGATPEAIANITINTMKKFEDSIIDALKGGKLAFKDFADFVIEQILRIAIQQAIIKPITGSIEGFFADFFDFLPSNEGGGFTGMGVRAGGVDGRGGFPAILHPRESVIDHTKGQGMGATVNFNISTIDATGFDELLATRKGLITSIINNAMNNRGRMGVA